MRADGIFLGTDCGATTSKTAGVWLDGSAISLRLIQSATNAQSGKEAVLKGWIEGAEKFLAENNLKWSEVHAVGLAIPGPYESYGVLGRSANLPASFEGWNFVRDYEQVVSATAGRPIPVATGNDGQMGGLAEASLLRRGKRASVLMLAPGSGLGCAFIDQNGTPLSGDTLAGMEAAHMPAPLQLLGMRAFPCGCGRTWGCVESYTTISGLPHLLDEMLKLYPDHELATSTQDVKEKVLSLRTRAQHGDALAVRIFNFQARALGLQVASLAMALDPGFVVIGGGLMDPEATTPEFRERYLHVVREAAQPQLWPQQRRFMRIVPASLGELSQAIGAALYAGQSFGAQLHVKLPLQVEAADANREKAISTDSPRLRRTEPERDERQ
jgi:predicted NBD/HSP70 family sugar kinase